MRLVGLVVTATLALPWSAMAQGEARKARLLGNPAVFFGADNYPPKARRNRQQGRVSLDLTIAANGRATNCVVTTSASPVLDAETCLIATTKMTYDPALDAAGRAVQSIYKLSVNWRLEAGAHEAGFRPTTLVEVTTTTFTTNVVETEIVLDTAGRVASCRLVRGQVAAGSDVCVAYPAGRQMTSGYTRNGNPIGAILRETRSFGTEFPN